VKRKKNILLITSSGGSGHLQAAAAKEIELAKTQPDANIVKVNLIIELFSQTLGKLFVTMWNRSQKSGKTHLLELFAFLQHLFDIIAWIPVSRRMYKLLLKEDIDEIIDVQPLATSALIHAIRKYNARSKKNLILDKVVIEFPTKKTTDYFRPIKRLPPFHRPHLKIHSMPPLLHPDETEEIFWQKTCNLSASQVTRCTPPIRETFLEYKDKKPKRGKTHLKIHIPIDNERKLISHILENTPLIVKGEDKKLDLTIQKDVKVATLMLGSQPARKATLRYVDHFINLSEHSKDPIALFIFCANQKDEDTSLIESICTRVLKNKDHPNNLSIVPMPYQADSIVAPLYHRSDATITRSGGLTSMELLTVARGQIWIHTEKPLKKAPKDLLFKIWGMPRWEEGNAAYLKAKKNARLICPDTFATACKTFFC